MQRQDLIRRIVKRLPAGSFKGLNAKGQQVIELFDQKRRTQVYATLEMLPQDRLYEIAELYLSESA